MKIAIGITVMALALVACSFSEYSQTIELDDNIDDYRTGCDVDSEVLLAAYMQWDANRWHFGGEGTPTPTPDPVSDTELLTKIQLEKVWEHGCLTGRRDVAGAEQATLMGLQDQLDGLADELAALQPTVTPTPTPTNP